MSGKTRYFECRMALFIFLLINGIYSSRLKGVIERLKHLEIRINTESKFRDEDLADVQERLDEIDRKLNKTTLDNEANTGDIIEKSVNYEYSEIVENLHSGYRRIRTAFSEEKYENERFRRQIPKLEKNLTSVKTDLQEYCSRSINKTEKLRLIVEESAESIRSDVAAQMEKMHYSIQGTVKSEVAAQINNMHSSVNNTIQELLAQQAGELLKVSKRVENFESLVMNLSNDFQQMQSKAADSCLELKNIGYIQSSIYKLRNGNTVYCDQTTDGGGWTVFQRRLNGAVDFYRTWEEYKTGFGDLNAEFWMGNELLSVLTSDGVHELRIDMGDFEGGSAYAKYSMFRIHTENDMYRIEVSGYSGNAGDSLAYHNGMKFTTWDNDKGSINCAKTYLGGWWYNGCHYSNLNGKYYNEAGKISEKGITWYHLNKNYYCLKTVEMEFR